MAKAAARAARITAGEIPDYLKRPANDGEGPCLLQPQPTVVQAPPEQRAKALIPRRTLRCARGTGNSRRTTRRRRG